MSKIYKGQTKLLIMLYTTLDLTGATSMLIKYIKPSGVRGQWVATVNEPEKGILLYEPASTSTLDEAGTWKLWAHVTFSDGRIAPGEKTDMIIHAEGV